MLYIVKLCLDIIHEQIDNNNDNKIKIYLSFIVAD